MENQRVLRCLRAVGIGRGCRIAMIHGNLIGLHTGHSALIERRHPKVEYDSLNREHDGIMC